MTLAGMRSSSTGAIAGTRGLPICEGCTEGRIEAIPPTSEPGLPLPLALLICAALIAVDLATRALRIQLFVAGAGHSLRFRDVFVLNAFGDAASAATPLRVAGEPARLLGLAHAGVPVMLAVPVLAVEVASYLGVVAVAAALIGWQAAPDWWATTGPRVAEGLRAVAPWAVLVALVCLLAVVAGRRMRRSAGPRAEGGSLSQVRGALGWPLAASIPLTLVSAAARVAVLPVLAQTLDAPPPLTEVALSSFALIYGQLFVPTPGGLGPVELAVASGAAGDLGGELGTVFLLWRGFITGVPLLVGFGLGIPYYGAAAVRAVLRGRTPQPAPVLADSEPG
jgi:uncharacterized membrane protein YbhN (UPF0104 family)